MNINKLIGIHTVQGWWRSKVATTGNLRLLSKRLWRHDAIFLVLISLVLMAGYFTAYHFAAHALRELVNACSARFVIELEEAEIETPIEALSRSLCECEARTLLNKNGVVRLALVDRHLLDPQTLEPVTEEDGEVCINALWAPRAEVAKRPPLE